MESFHLEYREMLKRFVRQVCIEKCQTKKYQKHGLSNIKCEKKHDRL